MPEFSKSLPNIHVALDDEEKLRRSPPKVLSPHGMHMDHNCSGKETLHDSLNDLSKISSNDPSYNPVQENLHSLNNHNNHFNNPFDEFPSYHLNDLSSGSLKEPIHDPSTDQSHIHPAEPSKEDLNNPSGNDPLATPTPAPLELHLDIEFDEFYDDMALHEPPIRHPPPNTPSAHSMQGSLSNTVLLAPRAEMEEDDYDSDEFEDSVDIQSMNLHGSLADCEKAIALFFNNRLDGAIAIMTPWKETSLYHAHGAAIFEFIPAVLTMEPAQIQRAQDALSHTFTLCAQERRNYTFVQSIGAIIKKPNYGGYTEEEAHAELVYAEALLLVACLGIIENEDMTGFLRASLRVKTSYNAYRMCAKILEQKTWEDESSRVHFESGVRLGLATFNVMIAMLPPSIVAFLEVVGFSADKEKGKEELLKAAQSPGLRSVLCELTLLVYYLVIGHFAAIPPDFNTAEKIISKSLKKYPNSVWFLMFKARMQLLRGMALDSIETYQKTCNVKDLWPQMKHLAFWELVWAFAMLRQWTNAAEYAARLERDSKWSRTIYMYAQAAMLIENGPQTLSERRCIDTLLMNASCYRQKLLGRSLPMEKFVVRRCERWSKRGFLVLPGIEWLYLWNIFPSLASDKNNSDAILKIIERTGAKIKKSLDKKKSKAKTSTKDSETTEYDHDDLALAEFLQGSLLAAMAHPRLALQNLNAVLAMKDNIKENTFLLAYATVEKASCHYQFGDPTRAVELLQEARRKYSGYLLEARLHFRIHSKLQYIHAGIHLTEKPTKTLGITGSDIIAARKAKPSTKKDEEEDPNSKSKPEKNPKKSARIGNKSDTSPNAKVNAESDLQRNKEAKEPRIRFRDMFQTDLRANARNAFEPSSGMTGPDLFSSINAMPGPSSGMITERSLIVSNEPMPSTSFADNVYNSPACSTTLKATALESEIITIEEEVPLINEMPVRGSVKREKPNISFEMDLISTSADPKPIATESASGTSDASNVQKGRT